MFNLVIKLRIRKFLASLKKEARFNFIKQLLVSWPSAEIYLVGGAARDIIIGRATHDFDFVVRHVEASSLETFLKNLGEVNYVGKTFGVFKFRPKNSDFGLQASEFEEFDIALPRTEHAWGTGAYTDV